MTDHDGAAYKKFGQGKPALRTGQGVGRLRKRFGFCGRRWDGIECGRWLSHSIAPETSGDTRALPYWRMHHKANLVVSRRSPQPASNPAGTANQPRISRAPAGAPSNPSRREIARSPVQSRQVHSPAVCGWNGFNIANRMNNVPKKYPAAALSKTAKPFALKVAQRNRLSRTRDGERLESALAS